jgi:hypothetical protein
MVNVLLSGAQRHVEPVAEALRIRGASVTEVTDLGDVPAVCTAAGRGAFDSYVQLPANFRVEGATAIQRVHHFYAGGVLARFTALDAVLPSLAPGAWVSFVLGQLPPDAGRADDRAARHALTRVLADAAQADMQEGPLSVCVLDAGSTADEIAIVALGDDPTRQNLMDRLSEMSYADLRVELLGLASVET